MNYWAAWVRRPQTLWIRKALFQIHLCTGIAVGLYIVAICVSGSVLVYRTDLLQIFSPAPGGPLPAGFRATTWLLDFHANLLAGVTGRRINGIGAVLIVLLCATGLVIWWPGSRSWRRSLTIDTKSSAGRLVWSLHSAFGFWFFGFLLLFGVTGTYLGFATWVAALADYIQPLDPEKPVERTVDFIQYWLAYLHFGRLGGRGIPGCGRGLCNDITKATWAVAGLIPPAMFVTGAIMWWHRVLGLALRRSSRADAPKAGAHDPADV